MTDSKTTPATTSEPEKTGPAAVVTDNKGDPPRVTKTSKPKPSVDLVECVVELSRNELTKIPVTVFEHEVPVLVELHGEDKVRIVERYDVQIEGFSVANEFERLKRRYNSKADPNAVTRAYPMGLRQLAGDIGVKVDDAELRTKAAASQQEGTARTTKRKAK